MKLNRIERTLVSSWSSCMRRGPFWTVCGLVGAAGFVYGPVAAGTAFVACAFGISIASHTWEDSYWDNGPWFFLLGVLSFIVGILPTAITADPWMFAVSFSGASVGYFTTAILNNIKFSSRFFYWEFRSLLE